MRFGAFVLLAALAIGLPSNVPAAEGGSDPAGATAESDIELEEAADTLTGALQGQGGLRIQTLCTHCNSANVQVGVWPRTWCRSCGTAIPCWVVWPRR